MSTTTMTGINTAQHIVQSLNSLVRADVDNEDNLIDPEVVYELTEIERSMVRQVYGERSLSLVAGSFFPSAKSEAGSGRWEWNETNPDSSPLNISSLFPSNKSETDRSPEFSRSNSDSIMSIFSPAMSEIDSPDNYEIIFRNPSIPSYYHCFPCDRSDTDSYGSSTPNHQLSIPSYYHCFPPDRSDTDSYRSSNHQLSIPSYYHCFPPDRSDTDSYRSSTPMRFSIPSLHFPPNKSEGIKMYKCIEVVDILQSNSVYDLMFRCTEEIEMLNFNGTVRKFNQALALGGRSPENLFRLLDKYDEMAEAMEQLDDILMIHKIITGLHDAARKTVKPQFLKRRKHRISAIEYWESNVRGTLFNLAFRENGTWTNLMESGDIHPLTETVMNFMKWIGDHSDTQNLFKIGEDDDQLDALRNHDSNSLKMNPVAGRLSLVVYILESYLEKKSKLYDDGALRCIFLMNNILYMKQKVKDSDLGGLLGDTWVRTRRGLIRQYAMSYLRASWTKVLDCLNDRGIRWSSSNKASMVFFQKQKQNKKTSAVALQERLKNFNACFEEIYNVQTAWIVPDAQIRKELRISILESVIPVYRLFMRRFGNQVESGRHVEKYYTEDNLENYLFHLFEGSPRTLVSFNPPPRVY